MYFEHKEVEQKLIDAYREIMEERGSEPEWAVHQRNHPDKLVSCTIPFIGKHYFEQDKKILVYASAEVLSDYHTGKGGKERSWLEDENKDIAINRHRYFFDNKDVDKVFPNIHIQPINDGTLITSVMYIAYKLCGVNDLSPREFMETIAVGNYGKYTIETPYQNYGRLHGVFDEKKDKGNIDYTKFKNKKEKAEKLEKLKYSHQMVENDINLLNPDIIILPESLYCMDESFWSKLNLSAKIVQIYQMNAQVIRSWIVPNKRNKKEYRQYAPNELPENIRKVLPRIKTVSEDEYRYVFGFLDDRI